MLSYKGYMIPVSQEICFHCLNIVPNKGRLRAGGEGATEDELVGWHHQLDGHEFEQAPGDSEGQGSLARCSPWGPRESDTTERLNNKIRVTAIPL